MKIIPTDTIKRYGEAGGPLPSFPPGNVVSDHFWRMYQSPALPAAFRGVPGSVANVAAKAGLKRSRTEPGIDPKTDPRAQRTPSVP